MAALRSRNRWKLKNIPYDIIKALKKIWELYNANQLGWGRHRSNLSTDYYLWDLREKNQRMFLAIKTPWTCMNLNWSKWIILLDPLNFGQDIIIRIGDSRTKTQWGSVCKAELHLKEISYCPGHAGTESQLTKIHLATICNGFYIHPTLQLSKKTTAGDTTGLSRPDCMSRLNRNQFLIGSQNRNWGLGIEQNHGAAGSQTGKKRSSFKQAWKLQSWDAAGTQFI